MGQQVSGHFTVTLACSLLAEAAQATTPPIPLLVAPAQGLPQLQLQVARVAATASAVIGGRREANGGRAGGNGDGCSSVPGRKGGKSSIDTGSHGGGNARRCGECCGCAWSCAATRSLREPLRSLRRRSIYLHDRTDTRHEIKAGPRATRGTTATGKVTLLHRFAGIRPTTPGNRSRGGWTLSRAIIASCSRRQVSSLYTSGMH